MAKATRMTKAETKLARFPDPAAITDAKIQEIAGTTKTETTDPEMQTNADVAEKLKEDRAEAKRAIHERPGNPEYFGGQGGAAGI